MFYIIFLVYFFFSIFDLPTALSPLLAASVPPPANNKGAAISGWPLKEAISPANTNPLPASIEPRAAVCTS